MAKEGEEESKNIRKVRFERVRTCNRVEKARETVYAKLIDFTVK